jgi:hypothetical protein
LFDTCALVLATAGQRERRLVRQARLTFAMARHAVADMCRVLSRSPMPPESDRLPPAEADRLLAALSEAGILLPTGAEALERLRELRGMYEPLIHSLGTFLLMPLPPWTPAEPARENWLAHL